MSGKTLFDKIWKNHLIENYNDGQALIYVDRHYLNEVTSPQACDGLRKRGIRCHRPDKTFAVEDHAVPTDNISEPFADPLANAQVSAIRKNSKQFGFQLFQVGREKHGIQHVIFPEMGLSLPGTTIVCGDSHTSTHGAFGAYAFGIGTTEIEMVLATQCILQKKPKQLAIKLNGKLPTGVTAKDLILYIIQIIGVRGGQGYLIEYQGDTIREMNMEERMTICNMSIEAGAKAGIIAADEKTFCYLQNKQYSPKGVDWQHSIERWTNLRTDSDAKYDRQFEFSAQDLEPMITYGTNPGMSVFISQNIPSADYFKDPLEKVAFISALKYMNFKPGEKLLGKKIHNIFIGSCTNARYSDLQAAANILKNKKIAPGIKAIVVPGSNSIKKQAEESGIAKMFTDAGFEWRWSGCSACLAMNNDRMPAEEYTVSTTNRNFENRQGKGARTLLASPITAAACALKGEIADVRDFLD